MFDKEIKKRKKLSGKSAVYSGLISLGFEIVSLSKNIDNLDHIVHMSWELARVSKVSGFEDLDEAYSKIYFLADAYQDPSDWNIDDSFNEFKIELRKLSNAKKINPSISGYDDELLDRYSMPILTKMVKRPENSPEYFIELANKLDELVHKNDLSVWAAGNEIDCTLDRPQIMNDPKLKKAVKKAFELELPNTLRLREPIDVWSEFMKELAKGK
jgi:hypothetical protein